MPVEATTLDGRKFTLQRKKKIESWKDSREQQVSRRASVILTRRRLTFPNISTSRKRTCLRCPSSLDRCSRRHIIAWCRTLQTPPSSRPSRLKRTRESLIYPSIEVTRSSPIVYDSTNAAMDVNMADVAAEAERGLWTDRYRAKRFTDLLGDEVSL